MKQILTESQLQNLIVECVQQIINEQREDEGLKGKVTGALKGARQALSGEYGKAKRGIMNTGFSNEYNGQSFKDRVRAGINTVKDYAHVGDNRQELGNLLQQINGVIAHPLIQAHPQWIQLLQQMATSLQKSSNAQGTQPWKNFKANYGG